MKHADQYCYWEWSVGSKRTLSLCVTMCFNKRLMLWLNPHRQLSTAQPLAQPPTQWKNQNLLRGPQWKDKRQHTYCTARNIPIGYKDKEVGVKHWEKFPRDAVQPPFLDGKPDPAQKSGLLCEGSWTREFQRSPPNWIIVMLYYVFALFLLCPSCPPISKPENRLLQEMECWPEPVQMGLQVANLNW